MTQSLIQYFCFENQIDIATLCYFTLCMAQFIFCRILFRSRDCFCPSGARCSLSQSFRLSNDVNRFEFDSTERKQNGKIYREELEMVMGNLGIQWDQETETEQVEGGYDCDDFLKLLEEKEPSLEEMKEAFDVFDEKRDGFIDAEELQRVVCSLGLAGINGSSELIDNCRKMIRVWDMNGDGMIDLNEFIKLMETAFC